MSRTLTPLTFLAVLWGTAASAASVDLSAAYQAATTKTERVLIEASRASGREEQVRQAWGALLPQISLIGRYTRQAEMSGAIAAFSNPDQYSVAIGASQSIFKGFSEYAEMSRRKSLYRAATATEKRARAILFQDVASRFYGVLSAEREVANLKALSELMAKRVAELRDRVKIGRSRKGELLAVESEEGSLTAQTVSAEADLARAREDFSRVTTLSSDSVLAPPADDLPEGPKELSFYLSEMEHRPDLTARREEMEAAQSGVRVAFGGHLPSIDLGANYYLARSGIIADSKWDLTLNFRIPLFQGGVIQSQVREATELEKQATLASHAALRDAKQEVRMLHLRFKSLFGQINALRKALSLGEENYKVQSQDYRYGLVTNLDVISSLNSFHQTKRVLDKTFFDLLTAKVLLDVATSNRYPENS